MIVDFTVHLTKPTVDVGIEPLIIIHINYGSKMLDLGCKFIKIQFL